MEHTNNGIDIDEELASVWLKVYSSLRQRIKGKYTRQNPMTIVPSLPTGIDGLFEEDGCLVAACRGQDILVEELPDNILYDLYRMRVCD